MVPIKVPPLGESIVEATVSRWLKKEGDAVAAGHTLVDLETDKITVEVPALKPGVLARRAKQEGEVVHVDDILGELDETAVPATTGAAQSSSAGAAKPGPMSTPTQARSAVPAPPSPAQSETMKSSPAARRIADERGIDIAAVSGTGRGGVVSKPDVLAASPAIERPSTPRPTTSIAPARGGNGAAPGERETREKMSTRRKRIAENL